MKPINAHAMTQKIEIAAILGSKAKLGTTGIVFGAYTVDIITLFCHTDSYNISSFPILCQRKLYAAPFLTMQAVWNTVAHP